MSVCYVVGAGDCPKLDIVKRKDDYVIAADGGYGYCKENNLIPDAVIGDFDSLGNIPEADNVIKLNPVKDVTDMYAAVEIGIEKGFREFVLYGATGGRFDHTLANLQLTASLSQKGFKAEIVDGERVITAITNGKISFNSGYKGYVSVFSHSDRCEGVTIKGLKYTLDNKTMTNSFSLGVSNEFIGEESEISVKNGTVIIIYNR